MKRFKVLTLAILVLAMACGSALAVPKLQTYIVDSDYHYNFNAYDEDSWISTGREFDLKVVGYWEPFRDDINTVDGMVDMVKALPSYDYLDTYIVINVPTGQAGTIWINGVEINTFYNYGDAGLASVAPSWYTKDMLPSIRNFNFYDSGRIGNQAPNAWHYDHGMIYEPGWGDEILMNVVVRGFDMANFDAIGIDSRGKRYVSPNSHDGTFATPEPGTLSLLGLGLLGIAPLLRKKKK